MSSTVWVDGRTASRLFADALDRLGEDKRKFIRDPERVLSRPPRPVRSKWRTPNWVSNLPIFSELLWLGVIVACAIAAIIGLRHLGAAYGVIWVGDR